MKRKITARLLDWKESKYRRPLILQGARQVGKTYTILEFAREQYDNVAYINFEFDSTAAAIFDGSLDPGEIIPKIEVFTKLTVTKGRTLIFLDEIQKCPSALTSLKYFDEFACEYHVVAAGSLLGVAVSREEYSFPVGKVNRLTLFPMDFEEFLIAMDDEPRRRAAGYHRSPEELHSGFNTLKNAPEGRGIKPLSTNNR